MNLSELLVPVLVSICVALLSFIAIDYLASKKGTISSRLDELYQGGASEGSHKREWKKVLRHNLVALLHKVGAALGKKRKQEESIQNTLIQAGYTAQGVTIYLAIRVVMAVGLAVAALFVTPFIDSRPMVLLGVIAYSCLMGWWLPRFILKKKVSARQRLINRGLPDAVDLMVVCVEAGLGLNQALVRVAKEIGHVSMPLSVELKKANMDIQTGTPREEAFRNLGERTGVPEIRSLTTMIIQADRFGTSVAQALRVHSESMRTKRRQMAEEAAAKTSVKLVFPLVFFVFPALFVVILGPAALHIVVQMRNIK